MDGREKAFVFVLGLAERFLQGENQVFIHQETQMRVREFMEKLTALYASMEVVALEDSKVLHVVFFFFFFSAILGLGSANPEAWRCIRCGCSLETR